MKIHKKIDQLAMKKGVQAELRVKTVAETLKDTFPIVQVKMASYYLDSQGVDIIIEIWEGSDLVRVPVQVKSSAMGAENFKRKHPELVSLGIVILVINKFRCDESLRLDLTLVLYNLKERKGSWRKLFSCLESRNMIQAVQERRKNYKRSRSNSLHKGRPTAKKITCSGEHLLERFISTMEEGS